MAKRGARVFVHHPHDGYVGIGRDPQAAMPITDFRVTCEGRQVPILDVPLHNEHLKDDADDPARCEYLVPVGWEWTVPAGQGFWQTGFLSRRVTVTELRDPVTSREI